MLKVYIKFSYTQYIWIFGNVVLDNVLFNLFYLINNLLNKSPLFMLLENLCFLFWPSETKLWVCSNSELVVMSASPSVRFIIMRRLFAMSGTVFMLRCITMFITSLSVPGTHLDCHPRVCLMNMYTLNA